jgi:hypothetical protein
VVSSIFGRHNAYRVGRHLVKRAEVRPKVDSILVADLPAPDALFGIQRTIFESFVLAPERLGLEPPLLPVCFVLAAIV